MLSELSLEFIRTRFSESKEAPQLNAEGFRRIPNPLNWPAVSSKGVEPRTEPDVTPLYLEIPDSLHSVQTLQFLGFQLANAKEIFEDYTSPEHESSNRMLGFAELAKVYLDAAETVADTMAARRKERQDGNDIRTVVKLTQVFMGLDLDGDRLQSIDPPERDIYWHTIKDWVFEVIDRRYDFLRNLDSKIVAMEKTYRQLDQDEAARKARNRKKAVAKKAAKQKKKALKAAEADEGQGRAEGDDQGSLLDQVEVADDAEEEKEGAQTSNDAKKEAEKSATVWSSENLAPFSVRSFFRIQIPSNAHNIFSGGFFFHYYCLFVGAFISFPTCFQSICFFFFFFSPFLFFFFFFFFFSTIFLFFRFFYVWTDERNLYIIIKSQFLYITS